MMAPTCTNSTPAARRAAKICLRNGQIAYQAAGIGLGGRKFSHRSNDFAGATAIGTELDR